MIRIREPEDLKKDTIPFEIKEYLSKYLQTILQNYGCNSLERIGCIYYLETTEDTFNYSKMGLSHSLLETPFEYCECIPKAAMEKVIFFTAVMSLIMTMQ
jgi:hypothetical protein